MKEYTREQMQEIERKINNLIMNHDRWEIKELCLSEEYALYYFVNKAMDEISTLEHIRNIVK
jgi:hypothetical protein